MKKNIDNKRVRKIAVALLVLSLLVGCTPLNSLEMNYVVDFHSDSNVSMDDLKDLKVDNTTPYDELITTEVDIHTFAQRYDPYGGRSIHEIIADIGIECLRKTDEGTFYSVHKVKQGGLLYVFYKHYEQEPPGGILRWFYVCERLSFSDFESLTVDEDTIEDVIKINEAEQIYLNVYRAYPTTWTGEEELLYTTHYLEDGIMEVGYTLVDGKLMLLGIGLIEDFDCRDMRSSHDESYNARILDIDWLE